MNNRDVQGSVVELAILVIRHRSAQNVLPVEGRWSAGSSGERAAGYASPLWKEERLGAGRRWEQRQVGGTPRRTRARILGPNMPNW